MVMQAPTPPLGTLFAIGGAEAKLRRRIVLGAFVAAAGGPDARIAVISSASSLGAEVVGVYREVFTSLGAREVVSLRPKVVRKPRSLILSSHSARSAASS